MVIKTDICSFSEWRVYPGQGSRYVSKDGKSHLFMTKKARSYGLRKVKAQKIMWTVAWRRLNKKIRTDDGVKKTRKRHGKPLKAIVGVSVEDLRKMRKATKEVKEADKEQALREIKARKQKVIDQKRTQKKVLGKDLKAPKKVDVKAQPKKAPAKGGKKK